MPSSAQIVYVRSSSDPGFFKRGVHLRCTSKKRGPGGGPILGPMLKSLHHGPKKGGGGGPDRWTLIPKWERIEIDEGCIPRLMASGRGGGNRSGEIKGFLGDHGKVISTIVLWL